MLELCTATPVRATCGLLAASALWMLWHLSSGWSSTLSSIDAAWAGPREALLWLCVVFASTRWAFSKRKNVDDKSAPAAPPLCTKATPPGDKNPKANCSEMSHEARKRMIEQIRQASQPRAVAPSRCVQSVHLPLLPPKSQHPASNKRLTVVLDLDHTLLACYPAATAPLEVIFAVETERVKGARYESCRGGNSPVPVVLVARPGVNEFLKRASQIAELVVFTAAAKEYAVPLIRWLDPQGLFFSATLFRDSTVKTRYHETVKDLWALGRDLSRTVLVDDRPLSSLLQPFNLLPCAPFIGDPFDNQLLADVLKSLEYLAGLGDVRPALKQSFQVDEYLRTCGIPEDYLRACLGNAGCTCHLKLSPVSPDHEDLIS